MAMYLLVYFHVTNYLDPFQDPHFLCVTRTQAIGLASIGLLFLSTLMDVVNLWIHSGENQGTIFEFYA